jgi:prepilin-type N-terminal cleavage/methylation domain-containing protein
MNKYKKGFTLIELLVVVAIIGILASVVLASLSTARNKGKDAAIQSELSSLRAQAEIFANGGSYTGLFSGACTSTDPNTSNILAGILKNTSTCVSNVATGGGAWAASAQLTASTNYFCVDSTGVAMTTSSALGTATACTTTSSFAACTTYTTSGTCTAHGCTWGTSCTGTPTS